MNKSKPVVKNFITVAEAARQLKVTRQRVYELIDKGVLTPKYKPSETLVIYVDAAALKHLNRSPGRPRHDATGPARSASRK